MSHNIHLSSHYNIHNTYIQAIPTLSTLYLKNISHSSWQSCHVTHHQGAKVTLIYWGPNISLRNGTIIYFLPFRILNERFFSSNVVKCKIQVWQLKGVNLFWMTHQRQQCFYAYDTQILLLHCGSMRVVSGIVHQNLSTKRTGI